MALETNMQTRDHVQAARDFLTAAQGDFAVGAHLQGSTKLWEAASHAMTAVAKQRNWPYSSRRELKNAARLLADGRRLRREIDGPLSLNSATQIRPHIAAATRVVVRG